MRKTSRSVRVASAVTPGHAYASAVRVSLACDMHKASCGDQASSGSGSDSDTVAFCLPLRIRCGLALIAAPASAASRRSARSVWPSAASSAAFAGGRGGRMLTRRSISVVPMLDEAATRRGCPPARNEAAKERSRSGVGLSPATSEPRPRQNDRSENEPQHICARWSGEASLLLAARALAHGPSSCWRTWLRRSFASRRSHTPPCKPSLRIQNQSRKRTCYAIRIIAVFYNF